MIEWFKSERVISKIWLGGVGAFILIASIWISTKGYFSENASKADDISKISHNIEIVALKSRYTEKDFMLYDLSNPKFYQTGETIYLQEHKASLTALRKEIVALAALLAGENKETTLELLRLSDQYAESFFKLVSAYRERGDKQQVLENAWEKMSYDVEKDLRGGNTFPLMKLLLTLKRSENNYMLERQEMTIDAVSTDIEKLTKAIPLYAGSESDRLLDDIRQYEIAFNNHITVNRKIGLSEHMGLQEDMRHAIETMMPLVQKTLEKANSESTAASRGLNVAFSLSLIIGLGLLGLIPYVLSRRKSLASHAIARTETEPSSHDSTHLNGVTADLKKLITAVHSEPITAHGQDTSALRTLNLSAEVSATGEMTQPASS